MIERTSFRRRHDSPDFANGYSCIASIQTDGFPFSRDRGWRLSPKAEPAGNFEITRVYRALRMQADIFAYVQETEESYVFSIYACQIDSRPRSSRQRPETRTLSLDE